MNSKNYPWVLVALLWVVALLNYMDRQMLATMKPAMMIDIAEKEYHIDIRKNSNPEQSTILKKKNNRQ